jgi:hypothetical protein
MHSCGPRTCEQAQQARRVKHPSATFTRRGFYARLRVALITREVTPARRKAADGAAGVVTDPRWGHGAFESEALVELNHPGTAMWTRQPVSVCRTSGSTAFRAFGIHGLRDWWAACLAGGFTICVTRARCATAYHDGTPKRGRALYDANQTDGAGLRTLWCATHARRK